jgi:hypothetical protein
MKKNIHKSSGVRLEIRGLLLVVLFAIFSVFAEISVARENDKISKAAIVHPESVENTKVQLNNVSPANGLNDNTSSLKSVTTSSQNQTEVCIDSYLEAGWNLFSSPVILESADMKTNFQNLINDGKLIKIQDEEGWSLENRGIFGGWVNDIGDIILTEGYKIKVNSGVNIQFCGLQVSYPYPIPLTEGWNIVGYPGKDTITGMDLVEELIDNGTLVKMQNEQGQSIENLGIYGGWQDFIGNVYPGEGYLIKVQVSDTLWIYENYNDTTQTPKTPGLGFSLTANSSIEKSGKVHHTTEKYEAAMGQTRHFTTTFRGNGVDHMNFNIVQTLPGYLNIGDELAIFDGKNCVGTTVVDRSCIENNVVQISASSGDSYGMKGFEAGNEYKIRVWKAKSGQELEINYSIISGENRFTKHESAILSLLTGNVVGIQENNEPSDFDLNCFPNPFNENLTIRMNLTEISEVSITVFDQVGKRVSVLVHNKTLPEGTHYFTWNGRNKGNQNVPSGLYILQVSVEDNSYQKKLIVKH